MATDQITQQYNIKVIIGLGNPGLRYARTRHNIGFMILDALAQKYDSSWSHKHNMETAHIIINNQDIQLIKPQTFMNNSGQIVAYLKKQGIASNNILVVHDELEKPFGAINIKHGGSARGHNGLKSLISHMDDNFIRLRFGISRPAHKEDVPHYVLAPFEVDNKQLQQAIQQAVEKIITLFEDAKN